MDITSNEVPFTYVYDQDGEIIEARKGVMVFDYAANQDFAELQRIENFTFSQSLSRFLNPLLGLRDIEDDGYSWSLAYYYVILMCKIIKF